MIHASLLFLADAAPAQQQGGLGTMLIPLICFGIIFYFMLLRPQNQKQKQQQALINSVKTGDKVVLAGGIHGLVSNVKDNTVMVKVADNVKIEVDKVSITTVTKRTEDEPAAS